MSVVPLLSWLVACNQAPESYLEPGWNTPSEAACDRREDRPDDVEVNGFTLCGRDGDIVPIDDPILVGCSQSVLAPDVPVFSVFDGVDARAYPIALLEGRELLHDEYGDGPLLVDW